MTLLSGVVYKENNSGPRTEHKLLQPGERRFDSLVPVHKV